MRLHVVLPLILSYRHIRRTAPASCATPLRRPPRRSQGRFLNRRDRLQIAKELLAVLLLKLLGVELQVLADYR